MTPLGSRIIETLPPEGATFTILRKAGMGLSVRHLETTLDLLQKEGFISKKGQRFIPTGKNIPEAGRLPITFFPGTPHLAGYGYDPERRILEIAFRAKSRGYTSYRYREVPLDIKSGLIASENRMRFFTDHIRGVFAYERLGEHMNAA